MGLFGFMKKGGVNINDITERMKDEPGAFLIDVREPEEYRAGHIPGSINISVSNLSPIRSIVADKSATVYVYCQSGARSGRAKSMLEAAGYTNVTNIGGIISYRGTLER